jgi:hypothetical protein
LTAFERTILLRLLEFIGVCDRPTDAITRQFGDSDLPEHLRQMLYDDRVTSFPMNSVASDTAVLYFQSGGTKDEARNYVRLILDGIGGKRRTVFNSNDLEIELLASIGEQNVDVLLSESRPGSVFYTVGAVAKLVTEKDKANILKYLDSIPELIIVVRQADWTDEARPILVQGLARHSSLPLDWIEAVAELKDSSTSPNLMFYMDRAWPYMQWDIYQIIKDVPGLDLTELVAERWEQAQLLEYTKNMFAPVAAAHGHADALEHLTGLLEDARGRRLMLQVMVNRGINYDLNGVIDGLIDIPSVHYASPSAWLRMHRADLRFDPTLRKYSLAN